MPRPGAWSAISSQGATRSWSPPPARARPCRPLLARRARAATGARGSPAWCRCRVVYVSPMKALRRRRAQPAGAPGRHRPRRCPPRCAGPRRRRGRPLRRHSCGRTPSLRPDPSDIPITTPNPLFPAAHLQRAGGAGRGRDGDPGRDPRRGGQARRPPSARWSALTTRCRSRPSASNPFRHRPAGRGGRAFSAAVAPSRSSSRPRPAFWDLEVVACAGHMSWARPAATSPEPPPDLRAAHLDLAARRGERIVDLVAQQRSTLIFSPTPAGRGAAADSD